jgi:hypothetical protein
MGAGWTAASIDEIPTYADDVVAADWKPLRHHFGIRAFGINAWVARGAGEGLIEEHDESPDGGGDGGDEEIYAVTRGRAVFTVDGRQVDAPAGTLIHIADPRLVRSAVAEEAGTTVIAVGASPGVAFEPREWEARRVAGSPGLD